MLPISLTQLSSKYNVHYEEWFLIIYLFIRTMCWKEYFWSFFCLSNAFHQCFSHKPSEVKWTSLLSLSLLVCLLPLFLFFAFFHLHNAICVLFKMNDCLLPFTSIIRHAFERLSTWLRFAHLYVFQAHFILNVFSIFASSLERSNRLHVMEESKFDPYTTYFKKWNGHMNVLHFDHIFW